MSSVVAPASRSGRRRLAPCLAIGSLLFGLPGLLGCGASPPRGGAHDVRPSPARDQLVALPADGASARPTPAGVAVSAGFVPVAVSAIGSDVFWVLGSTRCGSAPCASVLRTLDGGRTFLAIPAPPSRVVQPAIATPGGPDQRVLGAISDVRFADRRDGWVFGGDLFSTHDGGASWRRVPMPGPVRRLEATGGEVWAVTAIGGGYQLYRSAVGEDVWHQVSTPITLSPPGPDVALVPHGVALVDNNAGGAGSVFVSRGGAPFTATWSPCRAGARGNLAAGTGGLWLACSTDGQTVLARSTDEGGHFTAVPSPPVPGDGRVLGVAGGDVVLRADGGTLYRSTDAGRSWHPRPVPDVPSDGTWASVGFTNGLDGFAVHASVPKGVWRTVDGGASWRPLSFGAAPASL